MTKSTITREQLLEIIETDHVQCGEASYLARMALAAMASEHKRNPVLAYADSYRDMAKQGVESVPIWSVITDLERNIAPLYRHTQPAPVLPEEATPDSIEILASARRRDHAVFQWDEDQRNAAADSWNAFRAAMLQELKKSAGTEAICRSDENVQVLHTKSPAQSDCCPAQNSVTPAQNQGWIPVSERMPENDGAYLCWDNRYVTTYAFIFGAWQANQFIAKNITHWMPLPAGPQEVKGE